MAGVPRKLTLIAAPAGFGKTTLLSAWVASCGRQVAWLSPDNAENDLTRFLTYIVAALQTIAPNLVERRFEAKAPNQVWVADITDLPTREGWLYLAVVLDLFARRVVGWSMQPSLERGLVLAALEHALQYES